MKKIYFKLVLALCFLIPLSSYTQEDIYYKPLSCVYSADERAGVINVGINDEFTNIQTQIIYNITDKFILFGTYNFDNFKVNYTPILFGSATTTKKNNQGYSFGGGMQFKISNLNLELLAGFERQHINNNKWYTNSDSKPWQILEKYNKPFVQGNFIFNKSRVNYAFIVKLSYLHILSHQSDKNISRIMRTSSLEGKSGLVTDICFGYDYKLLANRNLLLSGQIGFSSLLESVRYETAFSSTGQSISAGVIKLGIQYKFKSL